MELRDARIWHLFLFLAAVLPLSLWPVHGFGARTTMAAIMVLPVLIYWLLLDAALGMAILGAAVLLLSTAAMIVNSLERCRCVRSSRPC